MADVIAELRAAIRPDTSAVSHDHIVRAILELADRVERLENSWGLIASVFLTAEIGHE